MDFNEIKDSITGTFKNFSDFKGRSSRREFWTYAALAFIVHMFFPILDIILLVPFVGLAVRRMHDIGKKGWVAVIGIVPEVLSIGYIIYCCIACLLGWYITEEVYPRSDRETYLIILYVVSGIISLCYIVLTFVFYAGFIWLCCKKSQPEANQWGPCPCVAAKAEATSSSTEGSESKTDSE